MASITAAQLQGDTFQSNQGSVGNASQNGDGSYTYTSTQSLSNLATSLTITSTQPAPSEVFTATINGGFANGTMFTGTIIANDANDILASGNLNGNTVYIYATNNPASQPAVGTPITVPAIGDANPYTFQAPPCFTTGTLIRTNKGDIAVEALSVGDFAVTASGARRAITWIGQRTVDCRHHPDPRAVMPVRIEAQAFGANKPVRDLWVSPGHAICVNVLDEVLVPAVCLVNGASIAQVEVDTVTYWHVELSGGHDILLADGLPTESYIDCGNRAFFATGAGTADCERTAAALEGYCRPFYNEGVLVEAARERLRDRAIALGWAMAETPFADLHVEADGVRIEPVLDGLHASFAIPAGTADVALVSRSVVPAETLGSPDARRLGVIVAALGIDDGRIARAISLDDTRLGAGFHAVEPCDGGLRRWTNGHAVLASALWSDSDGGFTLSVHLAGPALPCWVAPAVEKASVLRAAA